MITVQITNTTATVVQTERLTSGRYGMPCTLLLDKATWNGYTVYVSITGSGCTRNVEFNGESGTGTLADYLTGSITIPHDCMSVANGHLQLGVRGSYEVNGDVVAVIPTVYADLGEIEEGAVLVDVGDAPYEKLLIEKLKDAAAAAEAIAQSVRDDADNGEFDGADGQDGTNGVDGQDGVSPTVSSTSITGGHRLTIVDAGGTTTVDVMDGVDGQDGTNGTDGQDGTDGVSPTVSSTSITGGHRLTIVDAGGTTTVDVMDGTDGQDGSDYVLTAQDKTDIATEVYGMLTDADLEGY